MDDVDMGGALGEEGGGEALANESWRYLPKVLREWNQKQVMTNKDVEREIGVQPKKRQCCSGRVGPDGERQRLEALAERGKLNTRYVKT